MDTGDRRIPTCHKKGRRKQEGDHRTSMSAV